MRLRARHRHVVVWSSSARSAGRPGFVVLPSPRRRGRARRLVRLGLQLAVLGVLSLTRGDGRRRRRLLLAGALLTAAGVALRHDPAGMILLPGLLVLFSAPLIPDIPAAERQELECELAAYSTVAQRRDLEATLDQYPDRDTCELRDILAGQALTAGGHGVPGARRY